MSQEKEENEAISYIVKMSFQYLLLIAVVFCSCYLINRAGSSDNDDKETPTELVQQD